MKYIKKLYESNKLKPVKWVDSTESDAAWLVRFEDFLDHPWQEDLEIDVVNMLSEYRDMFDTAPEMAKTYFYNWKKVNSNALSDQRLTDKFTSMIDTL